MTKTKTHNHILKTWKFKHNLPRGTGLKDARIIKMNLPEPYTYQLILDSIYSKSNSSLFKSLKSAKKFFSREYQTYKYYGIKSEWIEKVER